MKSKKDKIINHISEFWMSRGVFFGQIIHNLKPNSKAEWINHLKTHKYFFIRELNEFKQYSRSRWVWYISNSFWNLYESEILCINYFKTKYNLNLEFASFYIDKQLGIDFIKHYENRILYVICKNGIRNISEISRYKRMQYIELENNERLVLFDSATQTEYEFINHQFIKC